VVPDGRRGDVGGLGDQGHRGPGDADLAVEAERGADDPGARLGHRVFPFPEPVAPRHDPSTISLVDEAAK
jgi:hypothetical protein